MSVLYLDFPGPDRDSRTQKLSRTGAHIVPSDPRWPGFFELAKKEKPYAIVIDFEQAPAHSLETADYLAKAKETRDVEKEAQERARQKKEAAAAARKNARAKAGAAEKAGTPGKAAGKPKAPAKV